jgi:outer membrane lipoprotein LolB
MKCPKKVTIIVLAIILLFLEGCAHFQKPPTLKRIPWQKRQTVLQQIAEWKMAGVLSVTYNHKRDTARFQWIQKQDSYTINIFAPLNISSIRIVGNNNGVELWRTSRKCMKAKTPEQLTLNQFGWQLPISNIRYWVLSLPIPHTKVDVANFDQYGHLTNLNQCGWQINYSEFEFNAKKNVELPKVIELTDKEIAIKIKITNNELF